MSKEVIYKFYDLESLTQEELNGLARERNTLAEENKQLKEDKKKAREYIKNIRQSTFTKYNSNEWNNCLSFNDDIKPLLEILGDKENE